MFKKDDFSSEIEILDSIIRDLTVNFNEAEIANRCVEDNQEGTVQILLRLRNILNGTEKSADFQFAPYRIVVMFDHRGISEGDLCHRIVNLSRRLNNRIPGQRGWLKSLFG